MSRRRIEEEEREKKKVDDSSPCSYTHSQFELQMFLILYSTTSDPFLFFIPLAHPLRPLYTVDVDVDRCPASLHSSELFARIRRTP